MTGVGATTRGIIPHLSPERDAGGAGTNAGPSFADALVGLLDHALDQGRDRGSVEMFNEHGFFARNAAAGPRDPALVASDPSPVAAFPVVSVRPIETPAVAAETLLADNSIGSVATGPIGARLAAGPDAMATPAVMATGETATRAPFATAMGRPRIADPAKPAPASGIRPKASAPEAASRLKVAIDHGAGGVSVSVTTDAEDAVDDAGVRDAVSRMLARHGLVLSELRVNRRAGADARRG